MHSHSIFVSIIATVLVTGCGAKATLDNLQTTDVSSLARTSGLCSPERFIEADDVSMDGSVIVGKCARKTAPNEWLGFHYSRAGGFELLDGFVGRSINELKVSGDGFVIWGSYYVKDEGSHIFRISKSAGVQDLGTMGKHRINVGGVSADGSVIVGRFENAGEQYPSLHRPYRYSEAGGFEEIDLLGGDSTIPHGVSENGSQVVGHVDVGTNSDKAVRYISTQAFSYSRQSGMRNWGSLGDNHSSIATGASDDGAVVVGVGRFILGFVVSFYEDAYAFVCTTDGEMRKLAGIDGVPTVIRISADGRKIAGISHDSNRNHYAFTADLATR